MASLDSIQKNLLEQVADIHEIPEGAFSLRVNGEMFGSRSSEHIEIVKKTDKPGIDIYVKPGDAIRKFEDGKDRLGQVVVTGERVEDCFKRLDEIGEKFTVVYED